jgi:hypothetical protein
MKFREIVKIVESWNRENRENREIVESENCQLSIVNCQLF